MGQPPVAVPTIPRDANDDDMRHAATRTVPRVNARAIAMQTVCHGACQPVCFELYQAIIVTMLQGHCDAAHTWGSGQVEVIACCAAAVTIG
jgi:hypothetical protein